MSEKLSASAVLGILSERVRRIESQSASVAAVHRAPGKTVRCPFAVPGFPSVGLHGDADGETIHPGVPYSRPSWGVISRASY